jgi:hypothetical protein
LILGSSSPHMSKGSCINENVRTFSAGQNKLTASRHGVRPAVRIGPL